MSSFLGEFNSDVLNIISIKSDENERLLNRSLSILCSQNFDNFNSKCEQSGQLFINLYKILHTFNKDSDALWTAISILQQLSKNSDARNAIITQYKFFPLLANILRTIIAQDKIEKLLILMQDLSYAITITWEEPYIAELIEILLREINGEDETLSYLALSVLINICYKNFPVTCLLLKYIKPAKFIEKIKSYGILANKMIIILDINNINISDLNLFIKKSFTEIEKALQNWNVTLLKHIVGFLINSKDFIQLHQALIEYENFEIDIDNLLKAVAARIEMDDSNNIDEHEKKLQNCLSLLYEFLNYILETDNCKSQAYLFPNIIHKIYQFSYNGIVSKYGGEKALNLFETVVKVANEDLIVQIAKDLEILHKLIEISENNNSIKYTNALQKLLISLLKNGKTQKKILLIVKESFFDKIFQSLLEIRPDNLEISAFTVDDLTKYLYCLLVLIEFSNISNTAWIEKVVTIFTLKQIQFVLAIGMLSKNETLCNIVFKISKIDSFPYTEVAKIISNLNKFVQPHEKFLKFNSNQCNCSLYTHNNYLSVSKSCEERLNAVMEKLFEASRNSHFDPATSELIEVFNYKMNILNTKMENFTKRLLNANQENTQLCHEVSLNNIELSKYYGLNYKMQLKHESLQTEIKDLKKQSSISKSGIEEMSKKFKEERLKFKNHSRHLEIKMAEITELRQELNKMKSQDEKQRQEIEKLTIISDENSTRITQLKQSLNLTEKEVREKEIIIQNKEKEIIKLTKNIDDLRDSHSKNSNLINHLEGQIAEKDEKIRSIENELTETEEMRKTILSIMESKKPKRKI